ncbi:unnamed protein product [Moneuplotes crassus]|uniref:Endoplasmic reticulum-based factor for assembly of V-ATPase n=1 Tax=Euplotes crassus TaxID=5936 RepID=A0AAD1XWS1_EUPCR|nr:unnamed protein product [Moneuplotes crassus]
MVFVKINDEIKQLIKTAALKQLLGCEIHCDKQMISYNDLELLITVLNKRIKDGKLKELSTLTLREIVERSQVLFIDTHFCNQNLKFEDEVKEPEKITKKQEENTDNFKELKEKFEKKYPLTEDEIKKHEKLMFNVRNRVERRKYNKMVGDNEYGEGHVRGEMQNYHQSLAFGSSFITLMFLGFAMGYYVGKYFFQLPDIQCYILSMVVGIGTLILETILYIVKVEKIEGDQRKKENKAKLYKLD